MKCPHCENEVVSPPNAWHAVQPWHCSYCGGLFVVGNSEIAYPIESDFQPLQPLLGIEIAKRFAFYSRPNHYVYALCYPSGVPFYIGMGQNDRCFAHEGEIRKNPDREFKSVKQLEILNQYKLGQTIWYHFLALTPSRNKARAIESHWIDYFGRRSSGGLLTNSSYSPYPDFTPDEPKISVKQFSDENSFSNVMRTFGHPDFAITHVKNVYRTGAVEECAACGEPGQYTADMRETKVFCRNCGHYFKIWKGGVDDGYKRQFFGDEVAASIEAEPREHYVQPPKTRDPAVMNKEQLEAAKTLEAEASMDRHLEELFDNARRPVQRKRHTLASFIDYIKRLASSTR